MVPVKCMLKGKKKRNELKQSEIYRNETKSRRKEIKMRPRNNIFNTYLTVLHKYVHVQGVSKHMLHF